MIKIQLYLAPESPHLIYCSVSGFGESGPYAQRAGYDVIAASIGGLLHITGPKVWFLTILDIIHIEFIFYGIAKYTILSIRNSKIRTPSTT